MVYCACVISSMLDDWSGVNIDNMVAYIKRCEVQLSRAQCPGSTFNEDLLFWVRATKADTVRHLLVKP